jgi:hypothetical protein
MSSKIENKKQEKIRRKNGKHPLTRLEVEQVHGVCCAGRGWGCMVGGGTEGEPRLDVDPVPQLLRRGVLQLLKIIVVKQLLCI